MISKINSTLGLKSVHLAEAKETKNEDVKNIQNPIKNVPITTEALHANYMVSFGASTKSAKQKEIEKILYSDAIEMLDDAALVANQHGQAEIGELHIQKAMLSRFDQFLDDVESGARSFSAKDKDQTPAFFANIVGEDVITKQEERSYIRPVIKEQIKFLDTELAKLPKDKVLPQSAAQYKISDKVINALYDIAQDAGEGAVLDNGSVAASLDAINDGKNHFTPLLNKLEDAVMIDKKPASQRVSLGFYDEKATKVIKNLSLGTNVSVTYDRSKLPTKYLLDTIASKIDRDKALLGKDADKTELIVMNDHLTEDFAVRKIRSLARVPEKTHVVLLNLGALIMNSPKMMNTAEGLQKVYAVGEILRVAQDPPKNVKMVFVQDKDAYLKNMAEPGPMQYAFANFGEISFPSLSSDELRKVFVNQPLLTKSIGANFTTKAKAKIVEGVTLLEGTATVENSLKLMKKMASYYAGKEEITEKDVKDYVNQLKDSAKANADKSELELVFDTGKKLKDIIGKPATKSEAESIVRQIKKNMLGTKGAMIYSEDASTGSGCGFIAKSIAGEVGAPFLEINAMDFGTEKVDILGGDVISPEKTIKKIFSMLVPQAEANHYKSGVLYIDNFEYLSLGDQISEYYIKAMSQLLREMEVASKKGLNLLVVGAVSHPSYASESAARSSKFIDEIVVESPARNIESRKELLEHIVKKSKLKLGQTPDETQALIKYMSEISDGFPHIYLSNLVSKLKSVAFDRNHKHVQLEDVTEAYLQLTTGRPASGHISEHRKNIVTTHEWGHGFVLERMRSIAKKQNVPWHIGNQVNFITLDPRGSFGGAMYPKDIENEEHSFEKIFSDLVCDFGGHSTEKHYYNIDGSWGITADMEMATSQAEQAVGLMGQGAKFGKKSVAGMNLRMSEKALRAFESDRDAIIENAKIASDLLVKSGTDLGHKFTAEYAKLVGTGKCIVQGDVFRQEIEEWLKSKTPEEKGLLDQVDATVLNIIESAKKGVVFNMDAETVPQAVKNLFKSVAHNIK